VNNFAWLTESSRELLGLGLSVTLLAAYHLYLLLRLRRDPNYTIQAVNRAVRTAWIESVMRDEDKALLAVQTLRNSTMAATFLASTAILLIIGTLNLSSQAETLVATWHIASVAGAQDESLWVGKLLLLIVDFFVAFFSFTMSVRLFNHIGYQVSLPHDVRPDELGPEKVAVHLNRAGRYFSIGIRAYYFSVPLLFWLFGPHMLVIASAALTVTLYGLDRTPAAATRGSAER
jgi:uncharacterized membrane protein